MNTETIQAEIDRRLSNVAALNKAMEIELSAISRLKEQVNQGKIKSGIGAQAVANRLKWEQQKAV